MLLPWTFRRQNLTKCSAYCTIKKPSGQDGQMVALHKRQAVSPPLQGEMRMVTYSELFQLVIMITGVATLFYHIGRHTGKRK